MNKVFLKGRISNEPEQRFIKDEVSVTRFSIAVNKPFRKDKEQEVDFINVVAWNKQGDFVKKYFSKGQEIAIVGRLEVNQYNDKDNKKITRYEVIAEEIEFCGTKKQEKPREDDFVFNGVPITYDNEVEDELPF